MMDDILRTYFAKGFSYESIRQLLEKYHDTHIFLRTLQQKLYDLGLKRRNINYNREEVRQAILDHCNGPGSSNGYRSVWHTLRLKGIYVYPGMLLPKFYGKLIQKVQVREEQNGCKDEGM